MIKMSENLIYSFLNSHDIDDNNDNVKTLADAHQFAVNKVLKNHFSELVFIREAYFLGWFKSKIKEKS